MNCLLDYNQIEPKLKLLVDNHDLILEEYKKNSDRLLFKDFTLQQKENILKTHQGYPINLNSYSSAPKRTKNRKGWHVAALFAQGKGLKSNLISLPILTKVLLEINLLTVCAINVLDPESSLDWHFDTDYIKGVQLLRILWGLDISQESGKECFIQFKDSDTGEIQTEPFINKKFYIFHPMQEHRVENNLSTSRSIICIDYICDQSKRQSNQIFGIS
jgi:hypothetical protein